MSFSPARVRENRAEWPRLYCIWRMDTVFDGDDNELSDIDQALSGIDEAAVDMDEIEGIEPSLIPRKPLLRRRSRLGCKKMSRRGLNPLRL